MSDSGIFELILIVVLLILNGIFSAGEFSIVSSRKSKIREMVKSGRERNATTLLDMKENPEKFLSIVQIGITLFGTLASAIGGILSVQYVKPIVQRIPFLRNFDETVSLVFAVVVLTYVFLLFGELVPKYIGINYRERAAIRIAPIFRFTSKVFFFFVNFLTWSTMFVVRRLHLREGEDHVSESEIKILLEEGRRKGVFDRTEEELIHGVFEFADRSVKEIMVPRPNVYAISITGNQDEVLRYVIENEFSRYPVYKDQLDNIVGVVYHKDITRQIWSREPYDLERVLKKPFFIPDMMEISILLKEMQKRRQHMAIVIDEYGTTVGIVTLEDIMEEIFGEIMDETDVDDRMEKLRDGSMIIDASYSVRDLNNRIPLELPEEPDYETLGGFLLTQLQDIARGGEIVYQGGYKYTVVGMDGRRIKKIKVEKTKSFKKEK